ncbi:MAG: carbohydrate ABC transporter permease [Clostridia bacterium]|nr:carbohydrate ABC transporter permease [Clostridia bacterium]
MKKKINLFDSVVWLVLVVWGLAIFYPIYNSILVSFMKEGEYVNSMFSLWVKEPTLNAYKEVFAGGRVAKGYMNTLIILLLYMPLSLFMVTATAYALSRKKYFMSSFINNAMVFTMYFGGGLIPLYLLVKNLNLLDSLASLVFVGAMSTYNMIVCKSFFYTLPDSLEESAKLDGANDILIYWRIYLPLAKPVLATIFLFTLTSKWNEWYNPMLFLTDSDKWPLQLMLREVIGSNTAADKGAIDAAVEQKSYTMGVKMATVVVTMLPVMCIYPFLQKYFMSGMTLGAIKE